MAKRRGFVEAATTAAWFVDNGDGTITDTQSKLVWAKADSTTTLTFADAAAYCQALVIGGKSTWRSATTFELSTLVDFTKGAAPAVPTAFAATTSATTYWTVSSVAGSAGAVWGILFDPSGYNSAASLVVGGGLRVRCVLNSQSSTAPIGRFQVDATAGTVYDTLTKLTWQRDVSAIAAQKYVNAGVFCSGLTLSGTGWRLPTIVELHSLVDLSQTKPAIDATAFPATPAAGFWTSSVYKPASFLSWCVNFNSGADHPDYNDPAYSSTERVRCVR